MRWSKLVDLFLRGYCVVFELGVPLTYQFSKNKFSTMATQEIKSTTFCSFVIFQENEKSFLVSDPFNRVLSNKFWIPKVMCNDINIDDFVTDSFKSIGAIKTFTCNVSTIFLNKKVDENFDSKIFPNCTSKEFHY